MTVWTDKDRRRRRLYGVAVDDNLGAVSILAAARRLADARSGNPLRKPPSRCPSRSKQGAGGGGITGDTEVVSLSQLTPDLPEYGGLSRALHTLGDGQMTQGLRQLDDGGGEAGVALLLDCVHKGFVDLQDVDR